MWCHTQTIRTIASGIEPSRALVDRICRHHFRRKIIAADKFFVLLWKIFFFVYGKKKRESKLKRFKNVYEWKRQTVSAKMKLYKTWLVFIVFAKVANANSRNERRFWFDLSFGLLLISLQKESIDRGNWSENVNKHFLLTNCFDSEKGLKFLRSIEKIRYSILLLDYIYLDKGKLSFSLLWRSSSDKMWDMAPPWSKKKHKKYYDLKFMSIIMGNLKTNCLIF